MSLQPTTPEEVRTAIQEYSRLLPRGGGSKAALSTPPAEIPNLNLSALSGMVEYEPGEFTFTALAGTPVSEVETALAGPGHYLPFDPLLVRHGATLGGVVATSSSGSGRYRYGGVRDFLLGIRFVDGQGRLVRGGGKVVKNSAGFDLPKLMVGSLGRLGVLVELTFKVFPKPETYNTLQVEYADLREAVAAVQHLTTSSMDLDALDLVPAEDSGPSVSLQIRVGGLTGALPDRLKRLQAFLVESSDGGVKEIEIIQGEAEIGLWDELQEFGWVPSGWGVIKIPLTLNRIPGLEKALANHEARRRYSVGGNLAWVAWPEPKANERPFTALDSILTDLGLAGLVFLGPPGHPRLGNWPGQSLAHRVKQALDPDNRFLDF